MTQYQYIVDASALLAAIHNETGGEYVRQRIDACAISSVNWSELVQKLEQAGADVATIDASLQALGLEIIDFTKEDAGIAAALWPVGKSFGLSLADRACLAVAKRLQLKVITADRVWVDAIPEVDVVLIR